MVVTRGPGGKKQLDPRQRQFVREYLIDLNGGKAAERAGYSPNGSRKRAALLLQNPLIQAAFEVERRSLIRRTEITQERVLQEIARIAFGDPGALFDEGGHLRQIVDLDPGVRAGIASVEVVKVGSQDSIEYLHKIKHWDKVAALQLLARHLGMLKDKVQVSSDPENPIVVLMQQVTGTAVRPVAQPLPEGR